MIWQLVARGVLGYAPLMGIPSVQDLHSEDTAFFHMVTVTTGLGTRRTAERVSLTAQRSVGGLRLAYIVECAASSVASDLLSLLNGSTPASGLARNSLREAMRVVPTRLAASPVW